MRRVLTMGTFAIPHLGHAAFLARSAELGDLVVGVNSDAFLATYRGAQPPFSQTERMDIIRSLGYHVVLNDGPGRELIYEVQPQVVTIGTDWLVRDYFHQIDMRPSEFEEMGISLVYLATRPAGYSSSEIRRRVGSVE